MTEERFYTDGQYVMQKGEVWVVAGGEHSADVIATALNELIEERNKLQFDYNMEILTRQSVEKENKQLKQALQEVYNDDYYLKEFIIAIINSYSKNRGVSPIRLEMIWDSSDMDKTSLKHLKSNFYE